MRTVFVWLALACGGCQAIFGIGDTSLQPDASIDAPPDSPPDAAGPKVNVGTGKEGSLAVASIAYTDDVRTYLTQSVGANSTLIAVDDTTGFMPEHEVLLIQMTGTNAGQSDTRIVKATTATSMTLDRGLANTYAMSADTVVQVIRVMNYTDVTVPSGARLTAHTWDGKTGGVVFFRATGTVRVASGGAIDAAGGIGGAAGTSQPGTAGGLKGAGGARANCTIAACTVDTNGGGGGAGELGLLGPVGEAGTVYQKCNGGRGGRGGEGGPMVLIPTLAGLGTGPGGGLVGSAGGKYLSTASTRPMIGGGGAGGHGVAGGRGGGGGGGGGGPVAGNAAAGGSNGTNGTDGEAGGEPGTSGAGGDGGGIVWIHANAIELDGTISVRGVDGGPATSGTDGGKGGDGGLGGDAFVACGGSGVHGGDGGAGHGAGGGSGGNGGGGGAGGTLILESFTIKANGALLGAGGVGHPATTGGIGGEGGTGFGGVAPKGVDGAPGLAGTPGHSGRIYIFYVDACTSCTTAGDITPNVIAR